MSVTGAMRESLPRTGGVSAIILYKSSKAVGEALLGCLLTAMVLTGYYQHAHAIAEALRAHLIHHWSIKLAEFVLSTLTARKLWWLVAACFGDAIVSGVEGWALSRGYAWGAWMVVGATGLLLPLEIYEMSHRVTAGRIVLFVVNVFIVVYLTRKTLREHHRR